jgi:hypothetical protein
LKKPQVFPLPQGYEEELSNSAAPVLYWSLNNTSELCIS